MEQLLADKFHQTQKNTFRNKVNFIRYADDFVITASSADVATQAKALIQPFLQTRGLKLLEEKTLITSIDDGFDMLGWNFRKYKEKLIIKPSSKSVKNLKQTLHEVILEKGHAWKQENLIAKLNPILTGWGNYHQSVCAGQIFSDIDHTLFQMLWRWSRRRHPNKSRRWIVQKYWHTKGNRHWVFCTDCKELKEVKHVPIVRHVKIRSTANPNLEPEYFEKRKFENGMRRLSGKFKVVWKKQRGICPLCGESIDLAEKRKIRFKTPRIKGGTDRVDDMVYVHKDCEKLFAIAAL